MKEQASACSFFAPPGALGEGRCTALSCGKAPPISPAGFPPNSIAVRVYATNVPLVRLLNAATVQKKNAFVSRPALWTGLDKYGGLRSRCGSHLGTYTGCAALLGNRDGASPHVGGVGGGAFGGALRKACSFGPAAAALSQGRRSGSGKGVGQFDDHPRKQACSFVMRRQTVSVSPVWGAPGTCPQVCAALITTTPSCGQLDTSVSS